MTRRLEQQGNPSRDRHHHADGERRRRDRLISIYSKAAADAQPLAPADLWLADAVVRCGKRRVTFFSKDRGPYEVCPWCEQIVCPGCRTREGGRTFALGVDHLVHLERLLYRHGPTCWVVVVPASRLKIIGRKIAAVGGSRVHLHLGDGDVRVISTHRVMLNVNKWDRTRREGTVKMTETTVGEAVQRMAYEVHRGLLKAPQYRKHEPVVTTPYEPGDGTYVGEDMNRQRTSYAWWWTLRWFAHHGLGYPMQHPAEQVDEVFFYFLDRNECLPNPALFDTPMVPSSRRQTCPSCLRKDGTIGVSTSTHACQTSPAPLVIWRANEVVSALAAGHTCLVTDHALRLVNVQPQEV